MRLKYQPILGKKRVAIVHAFWLKLDPKFWPGLLIA